MGIDFAALKKNSGRTLEQLTAEVEKLNSKGGQVDERFWSPSKDKSGNGYAIVRWLPAPPDEDWPFVRRWDHGFQGPSGKWYIELSRTSLGPNEKDPCGEFNSHLWQLSGNDDESPYRKQAREQKRRLHYISNVLVLRDSLKPECEGKVYLYRYGKKIFDKLNDAMNPPFEGVAKLNPFDLWKGADFHLKIRTTTEGKKKWPNYDQSAFGQSGPTSKLAVGPDGEVKAVPYTDEELRKLYESEHSLKQFLDPKLFKSYDELKALLNGVLEASGPGAQVTRRAEEEDQVWARTQSPPVFKTAEPKSDRSLAPASPDEGDDLKYFERLAAGKTDEEIPF